jgi:hypothetical protein
MTPLLPQQPVTAAGDLPSREFHEAFDAMVRIVSAHEAKFRAIAAILDPAGGATVDAQARAAIAAIIDAAT